MDFTKHIQGVANRKKNVVYNRPNLTITNQYEKNYVPNCHQSIQEVVALSTLNLRNFSLVWCKQGQDTFHSLFACWYYVRGGQRETIITFISKLKRDNITKNIRQMALWQIGVIVYIMFLKNCLKQIVLHIAFRSTSCFVKLS